jgi:hypothetical protein
VIVCLTVLWTAMMLLARHPAVSRHLRRIAFAVCVGLTAALLAWTVGVSRPHEPVYASDLFQVWASARAWLQHQDPYLAVGPGRLFESRFPQMYPMTAIVTVLPLAVLPMLWADALFVGLGFGLLTWAITAERLVPPAAVGLVSLAALMALQTSQWSLLLTAAALIPGLGWLLIAKPTIGLALFVAFPRWKTAIGCAVLFVLATLLWPAWIVEWRTALTSVPHVVAPITRRAGPLVLLALLRWRRADARLLLALACVPHTTAPYETIPLFLIPETWLQAWSLWALALIAYFAQWMSGPYASQSAYWASGAEWIVALMYLPCVVMILLRPNVSTSPNRLDLLDDANAARPGCDVDLACDAGVGNGSDTRRSRRVVA